MGIPGSTDSTEYRYQGEKVDAVLVDEAQFLSEKEVDILSDIVDFYEIPVLCYGLRTDFRNRLFPGSRRLMEIADVLEEVPTVCWCGRRAQCNTRYADGKIVREGAQIMLGANESYVALCRKHYKEGRTVEGILMKNEKSQEKRAYQEMLQAAIRRLKGRPGSGHCRKIGTFIIQKNTSREVLSLQGYQDSQPGNDGVRVRCLTVWR